MMVLVTSEISKIIPMIIKMPMMILEILNQLIFQINSQNKEQKIRIKMIKMCK